MWSGINYSTSSSSSSTSASLNYSFPMMATVQQVQQPFFTASCYVDIPISPEFINSTDCSSLHSVPIMTYYQQNMYGFYVEYSERGLTRNGKSTLCELGKPMLETIYEESDDDLMELEVADRIENDDNSNKILRND